MAFACCAAVATQPFDPREFRGDPSRDSSVRFIHSAISAPPSTRPSAKATQTTGISSGVMCANMAGEATRHALESRAPRPASRAVAAPLDQNTSTVVGVLISTEPAELIVMPENTSLQGKGIAGEV